MSIKVRKDPKTGKKQYRCRYYYHDTDGILHDTNTGWFSSEKEASDEAARLKEIKESANALDNEKRRDRLVTSVFSDFINSLKEADEEDKTTTSNKTYYFVASAIEKKYTPKSIKKLLVKELSAASFYSWLSYMNDKKDIGGKYIRSCKLILDKFNMYLFNNGYYMTLTQSTDNKQAMKLVTLKGIEYHNREKAKKRHWLKIDQVHELTGYFKDKGLGDFKNFYWYTLFYVLYFSGMRVEELVGLRWKAVDFRTKKLIIRDAITRLEGDEKVYARIAEGLEKVKNDPSKRTIPIWDCYYQLLLDYKESFGYQYNIADEEIQECFVFPNLAQDGPHKYQKHDNILKALRKAAEATGLPETDSQMLRHSCAYLLVLNEPDGLGMERKNVYDYFGHDNENMLNEIYARFEEEQKAKYLEKTFAVLATPPEKSEEEKKTESARVKLINELKNYYENSHEARNDRILKQIKFVENDKSRDIYYYYAKDADVINKYIEENDSRLIFVERPEEEIA